MIENSKRYFFYILRCCDDSFYCGITKDLTRRLEEHNTHKKGAKYTKSRRPVQMVYSEQYESVQLAMKREIQVKQWPREKKKSLIEANI